MLTVENIKLRIISEATSLRRSLTSYGTIVPTSSGALLRHRAALLLLLLWIAVGTYAQKKQPRSAIRTVKVGYFESSGMMDGAHKGERKSGYCYDYLMHVASYLGWEYEFCYGTFAELYEKLKCGEIDVLPYTNKNSRREGEVLFSDVVLAEEEYYIAVNPGCDMAVRNQIWRLNGVVVADVEGYDSNSLLIDFLKRNNIRNEIKYYPSIESAWEAMRNGEVSATVYTSNSFSADGWMAVCSFGKKPTYIAVAKNDPDLLRDLNFATKLIEEQSPSYFKNLYEKYFSDNPTRKVLTDHELEWVSAHPVIRVGGFANDAPYIYSYDEATQTATGLTVDLVNGIIERLGLDMKAEFRCYASVDEMEKALDRHEIDVMAPFYPNYDVAEKHNLILSNIFRVSNMELVYKMGTSYEDALSKIATPVTKLGVYYVQDTYPKAEIVGAVSIQDAVDKVRRGEAKGAIAQNYVMHYVKGQYDDLNSLVLPAGCGTCFATRLDNYLLIRILNRGLLYFQNAEVLAISSKYTLEHDVTLKSFLVSHKWLVGLVVLALFAVLLYGMRKMYKLRKKAENANQSKTNFLFNMSHDVRTPLNAVIGYTNLAKDNIGNKERVAEYIDKSLQSSTLLLRLINSVLDMSRIEVGQGKLEEAPGDVMLSFANLEATMRERAEERKIDLSFEIGNVTDRYVYVDYEKCNRVFMNIIINALKFTKSGGRVEVRCEQIGKRNDGYGIYQYTFKDNGIGMSEEFQEHVFEQFAREYNSTTIGIQGTGLGLAICKSFVTLMNGTIECESKQGYGSKFTVTLPLRIQKVPEKVEYEEQVYGSTFVNMEKEHTDATTDLVLSGRMVLLVEDNDLNREIAQCLLEEHGMSVETAFNGHDAVEMVKDKGLEYYDCVLMDIQMPVMDGYEATRAIRDLERSAAAHVENERIHNSQCIMHNDVMSPTADQEAVDRRPLTVDVGKHLPIIALSANAFAEDRQKSLDAGMDGHIAKPIDVPELMNTLAKFLK